MGLTKLPSRASVHGGCPEGEGAAADAVTFTVDAAVPTDFGLFTGARREGRTAWVQVPRLSGNNP